MPGKFLTTMEGGTVLVKVNGGYQGWLLCNLCGGIADYKEEENEKVD